jgi:hypothetical protein
MDELPLTDWVPGALRVSTAVPVPPAASVAEGLADGQGVALSDRLATPRVGDTLALVQALSAGVLLAPRTKDAVAPAAGEAVSCADAVAPAEALAPLCRLALALTVEEGEALLNREELLFEEGVPVALRQRETVAESVEERDKVSLWYGVQVTVEVARSDTR